MTIYGMKIIKFRYKNELKKLSAACNTYKKHIRELMNILISIN